MRTRHIILGLLSFSFIILNADEINQQDNPYPRKKQVPPQDGQQPDENVADRDSNRFEYNLYDRQQNRLDQQERTDRLQQQQQYYYQQNSGRNNNDTQTQYRRSKPQRSQYFNPIDE